MSESFKLTENHADAPVPDDEVVGGLSIALVLIGVSITLPAFLVGAAILSGLGAARAGIALALSGVVLFVFASLTMRLGAATRLTTYSIIGATFGERGALVVNAVITFALLGWFGVTAALFGEATSASIESVFAVSLPVPAFTILGGILMTATTVFGFSAISKLSRIAVPFLIILMIAGAYITLSGTSWIDLVEPKPAMPGAVTTIGSAISVVIGSFMIGVAIAPDIARFARTKRAGIYAALLCYGIGGPLVLYASGLPALVTGSNDLIGNMTAIGLGLPALMVVVFATWTTNACNLYSASLGFAKMLPGRSDWLVTACAGGVGVSLALVGILDHFVPFLVLLSVAIPPIAGVYVVHFSISSKAQEPDFNVLALLAWFLGSLVGIATYFKAISLSTIPAFDALVVSALVYFITSRVQSAQRESISISKVQE